MKKKDDFSENLLKKQDSPVRLSVLAELYQSGSEALPKPASVTECLSDSHSGVRHLAVAVLRKIGAPGIPALIQALDGNRETTLRQAAAAALADFGAESAPAVPGLCTCLESEEDQLRWHAGYALAQIGTPAIPALTKMLKSRNSGVVVSALASFELMGTTAAKSIENIQTFADHPDPHVRIQCLATLVKVTGEPSTGLPMLLSLLTEESDPALRTAYIEKIGMLGKDATDANETILKYFSDSSPAVRAAAAIALARTNRDFSSSEPEWLTLLSDPDPDVRSSAVMAIASYGNEAAAALPDLEKISQQEPSAVASAAIKKITGESA